MIGNVYRADAKSLDNEARKAYKAYFKGKELKGVVAIEYYPEMNL